MLGMENKESVTREEVERLYQMLKKVQEAKGYYFNANKELTFDLIEGLILNKQRYGYMCCPCRIAADNREKDKDIICPCVYRAPDVEEYGSCYCNLYVSREWNEGKIPHDYVPERRPPEKFDI
jgi:ferredoxin-thioredoxin reductase catalytic subunit